MQTQMLSKSFVMAAATMLLMSGCGTLDLRPTTHRTSPTSEQVKRGRSLLKKMEQAHGASVFRSKSTLPLNVDDDWSMAPFPLNLRIPFGTEKQSYVLEMAPKAETSLAFSSGTLDGETWAVGDNGQGIRRINGAQVESEDEASIRRTVQSLAFFFQAPFMLNDADVVFDLGEETFDEKIYERVFISWGTAEPQDDVDQFIAWIEKDTSHLAYLEHTLRSFVKSRSGVVAYRDHRSVDGVVIAHEVTSVDGVGGPPKIHQMKVRSVQSD
ncbi:MAG: hypothetical protein GY822_23515 [Deltaproteobacteria bacterium]|nr:hypothetical protein [Deltaproteobacteria bacterium]